MATEVASPFQCGGTVKYIPAGRHVIRATGTSTVTHLQINGDPSSAQAQFFLKDGDAIELDTDYPVGVLNITGNAFIYFGPVKRVPR